MPDLRQEQERRQQTRLGTWLGVGSALSMAAVTAAALALRGEQRAVQALQDAVFATERVILAVDRALLPSDDAHDARGGVLDEVCDLRSRMLAEGAGRGGLRELRICEVERVRGLLAQGEPVQAHERLDRLTATLQRSMSGGTDADGTIQWLRACDTIGDVAPARLEGAGCGAEAQKQAIQNHHEKPDFREALADRQVGLAEARRRKADVALNREDYSAAVAHWREAVSHYGQARNAQPGSDRTQRIALDEAATLIAVAAFEMPLRHQKASTQARLAAKLLLDQVQASSPKDPEVQTYARELAAKWAELSTNAATR